MSDSRADLGASGVGNLVDLGRAADIYAHPVAALRFAADPAQLDQRSRAPQCLYRDLWHFSFSRRAAGLFFDPYLAHAASPAGDIGRGKFRARPDYARSVLVLLAGASDADDCADPHALTAREW